ncbi:MAG: PEP-utilizing enzyme [Candidatus Woesearchaeota archaeon]
MNEFDKIEISKISNKELFDLLKEATGFYIENFSYGFIIEPMDFVLPGLLETGLIKKGYTPAEISIMLVVADISFLNKEEQELIKIAQQPKEKQKELLEKHAFEYKWLKTGHFGRQDILFSYFEEKLEEIKQKDLDKELGELKNFKKNVEKEKKDILKKKPVDKETQVLLEIIDEFGPLHDKRKKMFMKTIYWIHTMRREVAKRYGYEKEELDAYQIEDLNKLKKGKELDREKSRILQKEAVLYIDTKKNIWEYYAGEEARKFAEKELAVDIEHIDEIKGMCASIGTAKGKAKIINGANDISKMEKGDILVTSMTRPEFVPAMRKASAIVTDEGGVTCHAAIVSRELNIPCIIGTKIATRVLKDGDKVEVDAEKGIVRKIS